jgi:hypothetical protein
MGGRMPPKRKKCVCEHVYRQVGSVIKLIHRALPYPTPPIPFLSIS